MQVEFTARATADLDRILEWLEARQAGGYGLRWFRNLRIAIESLADTPQRCPLAPESSAFPFEVRHLLFGKRPHVLRILYRIDPEKVTILHIRHGRRQPLR